MGPGLLPPGVDVVRIVSAPGCRLATTPLPSPHPLLHSQCKYQPPPSTCAGVPGPCFWITDIRPPGHAAALAARHAQQGSAADTQNCTHLSSCWAVWAFIRGRRGPRYGTWPAAARHGRRPHCDYRCRDRASGLTTYGRLATPQQPCFLAGSTNQLPYCTAGSSQLLCTLDPCPVLPRGRPVWHGASGIRNPCRLNSEYRGQDHASNWQGHLGTQRFRAYMVHSKTGASGTQDSIHLPPCRSAAAGAVGALVTARWTP